MGSSLSPADNASLVTEHQRYVATGQPLRHGAVVPSVAASGGHGPQSVSRKAKTYLK